MTTLETRLHRFVSRCKSALRPRPRSLHVAKATPDLDTPEVAKATPDLDTPEVAKATPDLDTPEAPAPGPTTGVLTEEMILILRTAARRQKVEPDIHPQDFIYWHFSKTWETLEGQINYYFEDGGRSAAKVADLAAEMGYGTERKIDLLEFASGYGCVSRHLKKLPQFDLVSCDIHPAAIDFLTGKIGVKAIPSAHVPEQFAPSQKYDIVFALSFFTHMPRSSWGRWLKALYGSLKAPGYLMFTAHGQTILEKEKNAVLSEDGFWFIAMSEQKDLDTAEYGATITMPEFVEAEIERQLGKVEVIHRPSEWWKAQDLWIIKREN